MQTWILSLSSTTQGLYLYPPVELQFLFEQALPELPSSNFNYFLEDFGSVFLTWDVTCQFQFSHHPHAVRRGECFWLGDKKSWLRTVPCLAENRSKLCVNILRGIFCLFVYLICFNLWNHYAARRGERRRSILDAPGPLPNMLCKTAVFLYKQMNWKVPCFDVCSWIMEIAGLH